jgi:O-antigen/teichoic acid export membrane protein
MDAWRKVPALLRDAFRKAHRTGTLDLSVSMFAVLVLGFGQNLVLARVLGPAGVGHMAVIYAVVTVAALIGTAGLNSSILRYGAAAVDPGAAWHVFRTSAFVVGGVSILAAFATVALSRTPLWVFDPVAGEWMLLVALSLPAQALGSCASHFLQARNRMRAKATVDLVLRLVTVIGVLAGAWRSGFPGAVVGYTAGTTLGGIFAVATAWTLRPATPARPAIATRELVRFGAWGLLTNALGLGLVTADVFCVSALVGDPAQVGVYFLAVQLQQIVGIPLRAYLDARFPEMTRLSADPPRLRVLWRRMRWQLVAVAIAGALGLAAVAPFALPIVFGEGFAQSAVPLAILLAGQVAWSLGAPAGRSMFAAGWVEGNFWLSLFNAVTTITANLALIPHLGIVGAAVATAATNAAWSLLVTWVCRWFEANRAERMAAAQR